MKFIRYVSCDNVLRGFGARALALRLAQNLSRAEVAKEAIIPMRRLARFEGGERSLELIEFVRLCLVLGLRERVPEWVPEIPAPELGRTRRGPQHPRRATKRGEPQPDALDDPQAYWAQVRWIWEP
jgi:transcriptional regulator with XRE-family HTH domain